MIAWTCYNLVVKLVPGGSVSAISEPEPPTMRERYRAQVRQEIKQPALRQLAESGPGGLSISAIGKQLGVSGPALYRYFAGKPRKADLLSAYRSPNWRCPTTGTRAVACTSAVAGTGSYR